jgi:hypothetical protein
MKKLSITLVLVLFCMALFAQEESESVPSPDFIDQPMLWDKTSDTLIRLSKESYEMKGKIGKMIYRFEGLQSPTRISSESEISFLISTSGTMLISGAKLYILKAGKKNKREVLAMQVKGYGTSSVQGNSETEISFDVRKIKDDVYELVVSKTLEKGEYAFVMGMNGFTFGID